MVCKVILFYLFGFLRLRLQSLGMVPACWSAAVWRLGKELVSGPNLSCTRWISLLGKPPPGNHQAKLSFVEESQRDEHTCSQEQYVKRKEKTT
eukprot:339708-Pelagomonas_calceolata.AAC.1